MKTQANDFPRLIVHAGNEGYVASIEFTEAEINDPVAWALRAENLRHRLLYRREISRLLREAR